MSLWMQQQQQHKTKRWRINRDVFAFILYMIHKSSINKKSNFTGKNE